MNEIEINDIREINEFKGITFSKFKKTDVKKELLKNLIQSNIEPSNYWSAELICAGQFVDLWEIIILFFTKYIHLGSPILATYIDLRITNFKEIINNGFVGNELRLRNNSKIRRMFCEIIYILCYAKRSHSLNEIKVTSDDFELPNMMNRFKAPSVSYVDLIFHENDPKELYVAINEFFYNISNEGKNVVTACYWVEWIMHFEALCKQKKQKCKCDRRSNINVDPKFQMDIIWIIWDCCLHESNKRTKLINKVISSLLNIFTLKYNNNSYKKRKYIIYFVISLLCDSPNISKEIVSTSNKDILNSIIEKIDLIYIQIKKNEITPNTDYLFKNMTKNNNLDKTIQKLEKMNAFGDEFIPRL